MSENTALIPQDPLDLGDVVLDRYRVDARIAEGGHSVVYRAYDERLSRPVCIKVFHQVTARDEGVYQTSYQHFVQEAFALSKLTHPNTLRIYDFGHLEERGAPFQVSEFMDGGTLSAQVRQSGPFDLAEAATMLDGLCGALAEAHHHNITHRDIKPQNILFLEFGDRRTVKLADFGIAKYRASGGAGLDYQADDTSVIAGRALRMMSPTWAAPEQMTGDTVGPSSDLYSMTLIAAYMVTGRVLFSCHDPSEAYRIRVDSDEHIDRVLADYTVSASFLAVIKRGCHVDPAHRFASVEQLSRALAEALVDRPALAAADPRWPAAVPTTVPLASASAPVRTAAAVRGPIVRVARATPPHTLGDRQVMFVPLTAGGFAYLDAAQVRVKLSLLHARNELVAHVKPLTSFVAIAGKRASSAVQLSQTDFLDFVSPSQKPIARARLGFGRAAAGHTVFEVGDTEVALSTEEFGVAVVLDFGPGAQCFFVYALLGALASADNTGSSQH